MDRLFIGVDIGGTAIKMGIFGDDLIEKWQIPTDISNEGKNILRDVWKSIEGRLSALGIDATEPAGIGVAVPGPVLGKTTVNKCVNLGWGVQNLAEEMARYTVIPTTFLNDANAAALGEYSVCGEGKYSGGVFVTLGTGVGGGVIVDGKVLEGSTGCGGEIGHICVNPEETIPCSCGNKGCIEQYASATGIVRMAKELMAEAFAPDSGLTCCKELTSKDVISAAKAGDRLGVTVYNKFCDYLGRTLASIACVTNPPVFIIGGGVSKAGDFLLKGIREDYRHYAFHAASDTEIVLAKLGNDAGIYGAAKAARDLLKA